jgi:deazaflavin-dependent oxidoreductase (nitroreductase family)
MRKAFIKLFINLHIFFYKLTDGRFGSEMGENKILLLTTKGRKSGTEYTTPLGYFDHQDGYLIIASNGGKAKHPDWYFNLKSDPQVKVQIKDQALTARAEIMNGNTRAPIWERVVAQAPQYGEYEKGTDRLIPVVWLQPGL